MKGQSKFLMDIIEGAKGNFKKWQNIKLISRQNKQNNKILELKMNNVGY